MITDKGKKFLEKICTESLPDELKDKYEIKIIDVEEEDLK